MRCSQCDEQAWVELRRHNAALCATHYVDFFQTHVERNIQTLRMFSRQDRVLVAVSGGKDSLALWDVLLNAGYDAAGLYIDLGITEYSARSRAKCESFAAKKGARLIIKDVRQEFGQGAIGITELARAIKRPPCSGCGLTKRYVTNQTAREFGFDVLATGHNLDDEAATLLGNVLHWQNEYLARQSPVMESDHETLVKKVKPLYTFTERETLSYTLIREIDYIEEECPNAHGATSILYKDALNMVEQRSPGTKANFLKGFLDSAQPLFKESDKGVLGSCQRCGEPTTSDLCSFCRSWDRARKARGGKALTARDMPPQDPQGLPEILAD